MWRSQQMAFSAAVLALAGFCAVAGQARGGPVAYASAAHAGWVDLAALDARVGAVARATGAALGVELRPLGAGTPVSAGSLQIGAAWSTMKVPVILARYRLADARHESTAVLAGRVHAAITESDNEAIDSLFAEISSAKGGVVPASRYVQGVLEGAGDRHTTVNTVAPPGGFSTFGQTAWSLAEGTRFYSALARGCLAPAAADLRIATLMGEIVASQRWGLGQAPFSEPDGVRFKGGWGPNASGDYIVRQFGIVRSSDGTGLVVGLIVRPADGTFSSGVQDIDRLADALAESVDPAAAPPASPCSGEPATPSLGARR